VLYCDTFYAHEVAAQLGLSLSSPELDWLPRLPERFRKRAVEFSTWKEARLRRGRLFCKAADEKWFPAGVYEKPGDIPADAAASDDAPLLLAEPVRFLVEYRFFLAGRRVCASSVYIRGGLLAREADGAWSWPVEEHHAAASFVAEVLADHEVTFPAGVVLDVGLIEGRGWAVVEVNPAWASGLCACDPVGVLESLRAASVPVLRGA
jgi:hypothetical protein